MAALSVNGLRIFQRNCFKFPGLLGHELNERKCMMYNSAFQRKELKQINKGKSKSKMKINGEKDK